MYGVLITVLDTFLLLFLINKGIRKIELFIFSLVSIIGLSFLMEMFIVKPEVNKLLDGFIPSALSGEALYIAIGIIGATIMPHNLYLHSSLVQTRKIKRNNEGIKRAIKFNFFDSAIALNAAFFVNAAILILAAAAFHKNGFNEVADITDAHELLRGIFGDLAPTLFAIALIAAGQSSTITGTLAGQIVMEGYLNLRISPWIRRLITRVIAVAPAVFTIAYFGEDKIGELLIFSQVILSLQLGFAVIPLIHFTSSKKLMGDFVNKKWVVLLAWVSAILIVSLNVKLVGEELTNFLSSDYANYNWLKGIVFLLLSYVAFLLLYVTISPFLNKTRDKRMIPHTPIKPLSLTRADAYQRIGIAIDFSSMDEVSIQHALSAGNKDAHYFLFHIVESAAATRHGEEVMDIETKQDIAWITAYTNDLKTAGYSVSFEMEYGNRAANIAALAIKNNIELLVMGAHGHAGLKDILFGSTVESVRHKLNIPVLVVR